MFDIEQSVVFVLSKATQRIWAVFRDEFQDYALTPPQYILIALLWKADNISQAELAKRSRIDRSTLGGIVERMERIGLVEREPSAEDPRANRVRLSEKGRALFEEELSQAAYRVRRRITEKLTPGEYKQLKQLLNKLVAGVY
ncbi:MarR family transcriptional regulator [Geomonas sp. Red32]|uniref:MarR family winged helix-turn-helix transcriptional regulator n=1 Tax=Geomonas sp. Red32 TaxID=2912856 RepID=UPI00202CAAEC|nr:MarR family transcriptional regulator [Geomonas sp. Red32]MCM0084175.1 MarR family transcriptional regulator [Geomonas sp. Red32]